MPSSVFDHAHLSGLFGDVEIERFLSARSEVDAMLRFEAALSAAQAAVGEIGLAAAAAIGTAAGKLVVDDTRLMAGAARDGLIVPELVKSLREAVGEPHAASVHRGATSQDVIDTALALRLGGIITAVDGRLEHLCRRLDDLARDRGDKPLMGRTRMQAAKAVTYGHRIGNWRTGFAEGRARLAELAPRLLVLQLGGAVGTRRDYGPKVADIERLIAEQLGLGISAEGPWHVTRGRIVEFADVTARIAGAAGKFGQDIVLMAQNEMAEARLTSGGGSSAMAHKRNPVKAETIVALARYAAGLVGVMHQAMVHEYERSGAAWSLEWLTLPQICVAASASLRLAGDVLDETEF